MFEVAFFEKSSGQYWRRPPDVMRDSDLLILFQKVRTRHVFILELSVHCKVLAIVAWYAANGS